MSPPGVRLGGVRLWVAPPLRVDRRAGWADHTPGSGRPARPSYKRVRSPGSDARRCSARRSHHTRRWCAPPEPGDVGGPGGDRRGPHASWPHGEDEMRVACTRRHNTVHGSRAMAHRRLGTQLNRHANRHAWLMWMTTSWLVIQHAVFGRQLGAVAGPFDDDLVGGVGQPIQCAVAENGIIEKAQPFVHAAI